MNKILVTEFINQKSLDRLNKVFEVYYDEKLWRNSKTAIVLSYNYAPDHNPLDTIKSLTKGNISVYARGRDYHGVIKGKLKELSSKIISKTKLNAKVFVDTAPIMEKPLAQYSGIGWQGKNTMLVSKDYLSSMVRGRSML